MVKKIKENSILIGLSLILVYVIWQSSTGKYLANKAIFKSDHQEEYIDSIGIKKIDSAVQAVFLKDSTVIEDIVSDIIDQRFKIYDAVFMYNNTVVINGKDSIIGKVILYTNDAELDSFYTQKDVEKTPFYTRSKMRLIKIKEK